MAGDNRVLDQVKTYLATLPPRLRSRLVRKIEELRLKGEDEPAHVIVLELVRSVMREEAESTKRLGTPHRLFCEPLSPFLIDDSGTAKHKGFIRRAALEAVWRWLLREAETGDALNKSIDQATEALLAGDEDRANKIAAGMRQDSVPVIDAALEAAASDPREQMSLAMQVEGNRNLEDLQDIASVFRMEPSLEKLSGVLPPAIEELDSRMSKKILRRLKGTEKDLVYPLVLIHRRLSKPAQILQLLTEYEGTDDGARLSRSRYALCGEIVLADMDFAAEHIAAWTGRPDDFDALLDAVRQFYGLAHGLSVSVDINGAPDWRNRLGAHRRRASEILSAEVERIPGAVRRVMRLRRRENEKRVLTSEEDIVEAENAVRLMMALKPYRGELAVNQLLAKVVTQIEDYIEVVNVVVREKLLDVEGDERVFAERDFEAAVRINSIVFGKDYAALLKRSGEIGSPRPAIDDVGVDIDAGADAALEQVPAA